MVFDASAILAILNDEPGSDTALSWLDDSATLSVVNAGEVLGKLIAKGAAPQAASNTLSEFQFAWVSPDAAQARRVGELAAVRNLSLADRFCIALAESRGEGIVTADRDWRDVPIRVPVEYIR